MVAYLRRLRPLLAAVFAALAAAGGAAAEARCPPPKPFRFEVEGVIRRSATGFTQGLEFRDGALFESTGRTGGETRLNRIATDGKVSVLADQGDAVFGEGLTIVGDEVFQLTWQDHLVFVYDLSGKLLRKMHNPRLGWGLASDGKRLFFTDGEGSLHVADPQNVQAARRGAPQGDGDQARQWLNELEYVDGKLYGNVWMTDVVDARRPGKRLPGRDRGHFFPGREHVGGRSREADRRQRGKRAQRDRPRPRHRRCSTSPASAGR